MRRTEMCISLLCAPLRLCLMQTVNSEVARCQREGHAAGLQVSTCGFGGIEPSHGEMLAAAASRKGQARRGTHLRMSTVHVNRVICRKDAICGG